MHTHASSSIKRPLSAYRRLHHLRHKVLWASSLKQTSDNRSVLVSGPVKTNMLIICTYRLDCVCVHWNASTMSESLENDDWNRMSCTYNVVKWSKILESPPPPPPTPLRQDIDKGSIQTVCSNHQFADDRCTASRNISSMGVCCFVFC